MYDDAGDAFGPVLRRLRLAAHLSQEELAERARLSVVSVSALERGLRRAPYRSTVALLGEALGLSDRGRGELEAAAKRGRPAGDDAVVAVTPRHSLPTQRTSLIGRDRDMNAIANALKDSRLVSVVGAGGIGKTQTALAAGRMLVERMAGGVWFVELAPVAAGAGVESAVAAALGIAESPKRPLRETLVASLRTNVMLLVLDNCEHVVVAAAALADALLQGCANLKILATSREPLRIAGERTYRLSPLESPPQQNVATLAARDAAAYPAVQLFVERARAVNPDFALRDDNAPHVAAICGMLDGIALAIELAAARTSTLTVPMLHEKLEHRFRILTAAGRNALPRHHAMRALIDWSYDLLTLPEQQFFERLSVFTGSFRLAQAAAVYADGRGDPLDALDLLGSLVDKSLVVAEPAGAETRYRLLESTRIYAAEKLAARGEAVVAARLHAQSSLQSARELERTFEIRPDTAWMRAGAELDDLRAALHWTLNVRGDVRLGQQLAEALHALWGLLPTEGKYWVDTALATVDERTPPVLAARLTFLAAHRAATYFGHGSLDEIERWPAMFDELGDTGAAARARYSLGLALVNNGRLDAGETLLVEAHDRALGLDNRSMAASTLQEIGRVRSLRGQLDEARDYFARAVQAWQSIGAKRGAASSALVLAEAEYLGGNAEYALELAAESLELLRETDGSTFLTLVARINVTAYLIACDRWNDARAHAREALLAAYETHANTLLAAHAIQHLAAIAAIAPYDGAKPRGAVAARLLGYVDGVLGTLGSLREPTERREYERVRHALAAAIDADVLAALMASGAAMVQDQAVHIALSV
jgi:predicted ATPase/transcriptional regulator with XRE-family HTH domain